MNENREDSGGSIKRESEAAGDDELWSKAARDTRDFLNEKEGCLKWETEWVDAVCVWPRDLLTSEISLRDFGLPPVYHDPEGS
jgi:hypothetical protein